MNAEQVFNLEGIRHGYDGRRILDIEELAVDRGEILAIIGPSGSGKSTLLRLLNFLEQPDQGRLFFDGKPVLGEPSLETRRRVTTVFQNPVLLSRSVRANLRYGARLRGADLPGDVQRGWLERLGLSGLAGQQARKLSAGEAQRVALARALIAAPDVLLLDEPTANLDPANVGLIERIVREEHDRAGTTIVLVTHNIFQARRLSGRTLLLLDGKVVESGPTEALFTAPESEITAAFLKGEYIY